MTGYFIYGDVDTRNYEGIVVSEDEVDSAPERAYEEITIAGRNGTLLLDGNRYENVIHSYDITVYDDYVDNLIKLRNDILSKVGYQVLRDSFNPDEKYLARVYTQVIPKQKTQRDAGNMHIEFSRKPQRFLVDGDRAISPTEWSDVQTESGELVTIDSDGSLAVKALEVSLSPIQDLNGYSKPWVGGAGKNKLQVTLQSGTVNDVAITVNDDGSIKLNGTASTYAYLNIGTISLKGGTGYTISPTAINNTAYYYRLYPVDFAIWNNPRTYTPTQDETQTLQFVFPTGASFSNKVIYPMIRLASETDATFAPYENICPISGHTDVVVSRTGVNVWDEEWEAGGFNPDGSKSAVADRIRSKNYIPCVGNTSYYIKQGTLSDTAWSYFIFYDESKSMIGSRATVYGTFTTPSNARYMKFNTHNSYGDTYNNDISINYPSTDTSYHAYEGDTYTTALGTTVYGGTLDVTTGVLTVTHGYIDMGDCSWSRLSAGGDKYVFYTTTISKALNYNFITSAYKNAETTRGSLNDGECGVTNTSDYTFCVRDDRYSDANAYKTAVSGYQLCYELATPQTYQLTSQQVDLLLGTNHLWSDGEITVEYGVHPYYNPTPFASKPLIKVTGTGTLGIGEYILTITGTASQTLYIDCETMEIYTLEGTVPMGASSLVSINKNDFPVLEPGTNNISVGSGITAVTITPRWWRI